MKIREARMEDAEVLSNIRKQSGVRETVLALSSERVDVIAKFLEEISKLGKAFIAEERSSVVGVGVLMPHRSRRREHCGEVSVMVDHKHHGRGIGTELMKKLIAEADGTLALHRLELTILVENKPAVSFYEKFGFNIEATKKSSCIKDGCFADEYLMGRIRPGAE